MPAIVNFINVRPIIARYYRFKNLKTIAYKSFLLINDN